MLNNNHTILNNNLFVMRSSSRKLSQTAVSHDQLPVLVFVQGKDNFTPLNFIAHLF
jgi:hypothetical protein